MMHRLFRMNQAQAEKIDSGAYEGKEELLKEEVDKLEL